MKAKTPALLAALAMVFATPAFSEANFVCPLCEAPSTLSAAGVVDLVLGAMLENGLSVLFVSALVVVGLPWVIAGAAIAALYLPRVISSGRTQRSKSSPVT